MRLWKEIAAFVQDEEKKVKEKEKKEKTRKRYESSLPELNKLAKQELGEELGEGPGDNKGVPQQLPPNGFDFMPDYVQIVVDKESTLTLKAMVPKVVKSGSVVKIVSDAKEIILLEDSLIFDEKDADLESGLVIGNIRVIGKQVGVEGIITAEINGLKAEILVKVISRRKAPQPSEREKSGVFKSFEFSQAADPNQRVKFERGSGKIIIATRAPSVATYFGSRARGRRRGIVRLCLPSLLSKQSAEKLREKNRIRQRAFSRRSVRSDECCT